MYFSMVDHLCIRLFLFSTVFFNKTFLNMGFLVVQWENENSIVNEKKTVGAMDLKEGTAVDISTGTNMGQVAIYIAAILKVCNK